MKEHKKLAIIGAHPDDELFLFGGIILAQEWESITVVCVTDGGGQFYKTEHYSSRLANEREELLMKLANEMGWKLKLLSCQDRGPQELLEEEKIVEKLKELKAEFKDHLIISHGALGEYLHPHHFQTACCVKKVFKEALHFHPYQNAEFIHAIEPSIREEIQALLVKFYPKQAENSLISAVPYEIGLSCLAYDSIVRLTNDYKNNVYPKEIGLIKEVFEDLNPLDNHPNLYCTQLNWLSSSIKDPVSPMITVIIPCSSKGELIRNTVKALPNKKDVEIIIVLSNADQATRNKVAQLQKEYAFLKVIEGETNSAKARNHGIKAAKAELILLLDADIITPEGFIAHRIATHQQHHKDLLLFSLVDNYDVGEQFDYREELLVESGLEQVATIDSSYEWMHANTASVSFYKRSLLKNELYFDTDFTGWGLEDQEWFLRLEQHYQIAVDIENRVLHQAHERDLEKALKAYRKNGRVFIQKHPQKIVECLITFGCRYAELAYEMLQENEEHRGKAYELQSGETAHPLFGVFTTNADASSDELVLNHSYFNALPFELFNSFKGEMERIYGSEISISSSGLSSCVSKEWNTVVSDFTFNHL